MSRFTILPSALAAALVVACAAPAFAAETSSETANISTAGLNLNTQRGASLLQQRVQAAARTVCGDADTRDMPAMADLKRCRALAMESADLQVRAAVASAHRAGILAAAAHTQVSDNLQ